MSYNAICLRFLVLAWSLEEDPALGEFYRRNRRINIHTYLSK
jgi:hypothetical protein